MITSKIELQNLLDSKYKTALEQVGQKIRDRWEQLIQKRFYDMYDPLSYKRTYQLLLSCVTTKATKQGNVWKLNIFMDTSGVQYKNNSANEVWTLASEGWHGTYEQTDGRFYEELINELKSGTLISDFETILKSEGLTLTK